MTVEYKKYILHFKQPGGTSRGILRNKETYILQLTNGEKTAYGECNLFRGLSCDDRPGYEQKLEEVVRKIASNRREPKVNLQEWPSISFGVQTLLKDWENGGKQLIFSKGIHKNGFLIPTNGLVWMGKKEMMLRQIKEKLKKGYTSIKLKIGAIDFATELELMKFIRMQFDENEVEIRVDANGGFTFEEAKEKLKRMSDFGISYIEQPIEAGQWERMAELTANTPIPIALDEELIGINTSKERKRLITAVSPQLLILKPALIGGFDAADEWKKIIEENGGTWVITSALESNIGLNAIAQYTALGWSEYAQGLGTGQLFTNNFPSPYTVNADGLQYHTDRNWDFSVLK